MLPYKGAQGHPLTTAITDLAAAGLDPDQASGPGTIRIVLQHMPRAPTLGTLETAKSIIYILSLGYSTTYTPTGGSSLAFLQIPSAKKCRWSRKPGQYLIHAGWWKQTNTFLLQ